MNFWFSFGNNYMDQRRRDSRFNGRNEDNTINWKISEFWNVRRENCFCFEHGLQKKKTEKKKKKRLLRRKQITFMIFDCFRFTGAHDTILHHADFFSTSFCLDYVQEFDTNGWNSHNCDKDSFDDVLEMRTNWAYVSQRNSKPYGNCTTCKNLKRYRCPNIRNWKRWSRETLIWNYDFEVWTPKMRKSKQEQWWRIAGQITGKQKDNVRQVWRRTCSPGNPTQRQCAWLLSTHLKQHEEQKQVQRKKMKWMEKSKRRAHETWPWPWDGMRHELEPLSLSLSLGPTVRCARNQTSKTLKRHHRTNRQMALTSLHVLFSWVCTCFRFTSTLNMLLCLLFCFVSLIQSSSVFPRIHLYVNSL